MELRFRRALVGYDPAAVRARVAEDDAATERLHKQQMEIVQHLLAARQSVLEQLQEVEQSILSEQALQHELLHQMEGVTQDVTEVVREAESAFHADEAAAVLRFVRLVREWGYWQQTVQEAREGLALWLAHFGGLTDGHDA